MKRTMRGRLALVLALLMLLSCTNIAFADDTMPDCTPEPTLTPVPTPEPTSNPDSNPDTDDDSKDKEDDSKDKEDVKKDEKEEEKKEETETETGTETEKELKEASKEEQLSWPAEATPYDFYTGYSESRERFVETALSQVTVGNKGGKNASKNFSKGKLNIYEQWLEDNHPDCEREYDIGGWNALFLCWCAAQAGLTDDGQFPITVTAEDLEFYLEVHGHLKYDIEEYAKNSTKSRQFSVGDLLFWPITGDDDFVVGKKVGLITNVGNGYIEVVTGNTNNEVALQLYKLNDIFNKKVLLNASVVEFKYQSVAEFCFNYFMSELGFNEAASCGILANILAESRFSPKKIGDNGYSIGMFQWQGTRKVAMTSYCETYGLDPELVESQLIYFSYEIQTLFPKTYAYLKTVENTAHGASLAADIFCINYEAPFNRYWNGKQRSLTAEETIWPLFKYRAVLRETPAA